MNTIKQSKQHITVTYRDIEIDRYIPQRRASSCRERRQSACSQEERKEKTQDQATTGNKERDRKIKGGIEKRG